MASVRDTAFFGGFLLTKRKLAKVVHFAPRELPGGWTLWADDLVATEYAEGDAGEFVLIRGHWADLSDGVGQDDLVADALLGSWERGPRELHEHLGRMAGRFVVFVGRGEQLLVFHDALGLRSVYYSMDSPLVTSHLNLLLMFEKHPVHLNNATALVTMDESPRAGVRHLLPNFFLDPARQEVTRYFPAEPNRYVNWSHEDRLSRVEELFAREMVVYAKKFPRIVASVTAGLDSRLMFALTRDYWHRMTGFTYGLKESDGTWWSDSMSLDYQGAEALLPLLRLASHTYIDVEDRSISDADRQHIARSSWVSHSRYLVPHYRRLFPEPDWIHLRGTGVEVIRRYWRTPQDNLGDLVNTFSRAGTRQLVEERVEALGYRDQLHGYHRIDIGYWEIRMGKWHAEILNEVDMAFETFVPIATREIFELLLAYGAKDREDAFAVHELINRNAPLLNFLGANDVRNLYEVRRDEVRAESASHELTGLFVRDSAGRGEALAESSRELVLPAEHFKAGWGVIADIDTMSRAGELRFCVHRSYAYSRALGHFEWQVLVDGVPHLVCDGAVSKEPVRVTVAGLRAGQTVQLGIQALRNLQAESWELASKTIVTGVRHLPENIPVEGVTVRSDSPYARSVVDGPHARPVQMDGGTDASAPG